MQRLLPPILVLILVIAMVLGTSAESLIESPASRIDDSIRLVGLVPVALGIWLAVAGSRRFVRVGTNIKTFNDPEVLVVNGPFTISRNPMYLGFTVLLVGIAILLGSISAWIGPIAFWVAADRWYVPFEERRAAAVFGNEYHQYCRSVRRWIGTKQPRTTTKVTS